MLVATQARPVGRAVFLRSERHQHGVGTLGTDIGDIAAQIAAVCINHLLTVGRIALVHHLDVHQHRVLSRSGNTGTGAPLVVGAVVVMPDAHNHPVARFQRLANLRPKITVESTARGSSKSLVLNGYLRRVKEVLGEISPSPLAVVAVAQRSVAHRAVTDKEQNGMVTLSACSRFDACRAHLVEGVERQVSHMV